MTSNVIRAVEWAIAQQLDVLSCSFGGETPSKLERGASVLVDSYVSDYDAADGASMSAPHVAAIAALVRALRPDLNAD